jgi:hypothetical protein
MVEYFHPDDRASPSVPFEFKQFASMDQVDAFLIQEQVALVKEDHDS